MEPWGPAWMREETDLEGSGVCKLHLENAGEKSL